MENTTAPNPFRFAPAPPVAAGVGVAPLVDIVLLLICFYLFVAKSVADLDDPSIRLPVIASELADDERPGELIVNLREDGDVVVAGRVRSLDELRTLASDAAAAARASGGSPTVVLRVDRDQRFGNLDRVQRICREAGVGAVVLRAVERE